MPPTLRKRKAPEPAPAPAPPPKKAAASKPKKATAAAAAAATKADVVEPKAKPAKAAAAGAAKKAAVGDVVSLDGFGGEVETNEGVATSLKKLVEESEAGVVLFTYPKASTPGCMYSLFFHIYTLAILRQT